MVLTVGLMTGTARAETALEVQSWCKGMDAKLGQNDAFTFVMNYNSGFCLGAFASIQELSVYIWENGTPYLGFCPPADSSRLQYIKIFSKYVDDYPASAHQRFGVVAKSALAAAFPCVGATSSN
jgi:hypothetical protein